MSRLKIDMTMIARGLAWCTAAIVLAAGRVAFAAQQTQDFVPATDIAREELPAAPMVYAAYGFVWAALVVYVFLLWRRLGKVERDLADVSSRLAARR